MGLGGFEIIRKLISYLIVLIRVLEYLQFIKCLLSYLAVPMLRLAGFSAAGPVAGTLASWIHATFYRRRVRPNSFFAMAQRMAMRGV